MSALLISLAMAAQAAQPAVYRAQGSDPAWSLTIADGRMTFDRPGAQSVSVAAPAAIDDNGETYYRTDIFSVTILHLACTDRVTSRRFSDSVYVEFGDDPRTGCGGAELSADSLDGTRWHFAEIAGEPTGLTGDLLGDDRYAIDFYADGFVGYGGCNRFSAGYERKGDVLTTKEPWGMGMGACREPVMRRERRLLQILSEPVRISFPDAKAMVLTGAKGTIKLVRTEEED